VSPLSLYRLLLRGCNNIPTVGGQKFLKERAKSEFKKNRNVKGELEKGHLILRATAVILTLNKQNFDE